jgi:Asp-tRNA(Asn)/Glu-tRNA(Gln) amidotransferase A subunit family amidase
MFTTTEAARLVRTGEMSARELLEQCIVAIDRHHPALNAWAHLDLDGARRAAADVDRLVAAGRADDLGPLAGVPFGVKDLEDCAGMPTTRGSRWYLGGPPAARDDMHVARLRAAGAIPIGKTTTPEFGAWAYTASPALGVTRNPWNVERTPGGSSGGSSAAVSAGMVPFCTASDGGGSIRTPAAFTGLPGLKPTYGRVPTFGVTHIAQNAVNFALATTVADTAL